MLPVINVRLIFVLLVLALDLQFWNIIILFTELIVDFIVKAISKMNLKKAVCNAKKINNLVKDLIKLLKKCMFLFLEKNMQKKLNQ